ncbi:Ser/Thr phosphatase family protein [Cardiosporidium cionae]|uniref:Ser/Thr phosphatase family protein n=1 Tax=Cardiosporidium cionae TaxID=476202 RepID=A0ABQ7JAQ0_9APIC|nr:Ser/Thr phosphatase family protein [Cardiosporidium cionae]|eukprot:KAF8821056.1 Ser/Thr phosphatase family protein [Cardiosporidium cionae]
METLFDNLLMRRTALYLVFLLLGTAVSLFPSVRTAAIPNVDYHTITLQSFFQLPEGSSVLSSLDSERPENTNFQWTKGTIYVLGDLHGDYRNTILALQLADLIDESLQWKAAEAEHQGGRIALLLGNHEMMNLCGNFAYVYEMEYQKMNVSFRQYLLGPEGPMGQFLVRLPSLLRVNGILFVHAGLLPRFAHGKDVHTLNQQIHLELRGGCAFRNALISQGKGSQLLSGSEGCLWTRFLMHSSQYNVCKSLNETLVHLECEKMIVGHLLQSDHHIHHRCDGRCLLIDTGNSQYMGGAISVLEITKDSFFELTEKKSRGFGRSPEHPTASLPSCVRRWLPIPPLTDRNRDLWHAFTPHPPCDLPHEERNEL